MNENLDLTKILEGCPKGTEFYSNVWGKIFFEKINCDPNDGIPIKFRDCKGGYVFLPKSGKYDYEYAECIVFPSKDQRDWAKFERFWDKPKVERFDVSTLVPFNKVLTRNTLDDIWRPNFFGYINNEIQHRNISCFGFFWKYCIPYNEETQHLVGTTDDCPEYYKWWEE